MRLPEYFLGRLAGTVLRYRNISYCLRAPVRRKEAGRSRTVCLTALPYLASAAAMMAWGRRSDRKGERVRHVALPTLLAAAGLVAAIALPAGWGELAALGVATVGIYATLGPFWGLPPIFLTSTAAAGGIALINSVGNLGGFLGPSIVGWTLELTHSFHGGLAVIAACLGLSVVAVLLVGYRIRGPARVAVAGTRS